MPNAYSAAAVIVARSENMVKPVRILLINYTQTDLTIAVETNDEIQYRELRKDQDQNNPEGPLELLKAGAKNLVVPAGRLFGFATEDLVKIGDPHLEGLTVITVGGRDPWPQPPPPPPALQNTLDYSARFKNFLKD